MKVTIEEFRDSLVMNGHDSSDNDCKEVMREFIDHYNDMFNGKDEAGNPTSAVLINDEVVINFETSDFFSEGDIESLIDDFFSEL